MIERGVTFSPDGWMIQNNCKPFYSRDLSSKRNGDEFHTKDLSVLMKFIPLNKQLSNKDIIIDLMNEKFD